MLKAAAIGRPQEVVVGKADPQLVHRNKLLRRRLLRPCLQKPWDLWSSEMLIWQSVFETYVSKQRMVVTIYPHKSIQIPEVSCNGFEVDGSTFLKPALLCPAAAYV